MATQVLPFCSNDEGMYVELPYDDVRMQASQIHVVVPATAQGIQVHIITVQPNRTIDQMFAPGTDQMFPVGVNLPIGIITNWKGQTVPYMPWLREFGIGPA